MSFLEELAQAAESPTAVWHQFVLTHDPKRDDWYLFLEGSLDLAFYACALSRLVQQDSRVWDFRCGGKRGVLAARQAVRQSHPHCTRCLFFIDKDLEDILGEASASARDVFRAEGYSVENYFVTAEALDLVWTQFWSLSSGDPRRSIVRERFTRSLEQFYRILLPIMAWVTLARRAGQRPNLNNINLGEIIRIVDGVPCRGVAAIETIRRVPSCAFRPTLAEWLREARLLMQAPRKSVVRGKFELWFFCKFLDAAFRSLRATGGRSRKVRSRRIRRVSPARW